METFAKLLERFLVFVYHRFDRIVIQGYLPLWTRPEPIVHFFRAGMGAAEEQVNRTMVRQRNDKLGTKVEEDAGTTPRTVEAGATYSERRKASSSA